LVACELDPMAVYGIEHGLRINDPDKMLAFYCGALGFETFAEIFVPGGHVWGLRYGNSMLKLLKFDELPAAPAEVRAATHYMTIHVLNAEQMQQAAIEGGGTLIEGYSPFKPLRAGDPDCFYVLVQDPEGNVVEFSQGSPWVPATEEFRARVSQATS